MDGAVIFEVSGLVFIYVNESARPATGSGAGRWSAGFAPRAQFITRSKNTRISGIIAHPPYDVTSG
jgi:hypothetical protein